MSYEPPNRLNPFGEEPEDLEIAGGYYVDVNCPLEGRYLAAGPFEQRADAEAFIEIAFG